MRVRWWSVFVVILLVPLVELLFIIGAELLGVLNDFLNNVTVAVVLGVGHVVLVLLPIFLDRVVDQRLVALNTVFGRLLEAFQGSDEGLLLSELSHHIDVILTDAILDVINPLGEGVIVKFLGLRVELFMLQDNCLTEFLVELLHFVQDVHVVILVELTHLVDDTLDLANEHLARGCQGILQLHLDF